MLLRGLLGKGDVLSMADGSATKKRKQAPGAVEAGPRLSRASARPSQEALQLEVQQIPREEKNAKRRVVRRSLKRATGSQTILQQASVTPACLARYRKHWEELEPAVLGSRGQLKGFAEVDLILTEHLEALFRDGEDLATARYVVAAVLFFRPELRSPGMTLLPKVKQSLAGWSKLCPPRSRLPIPYPVVALQAMHALSLGLLEMAIYLLLTFALYMRPSEGLRLRKMDVVRPSSRQAGFQFWSVVLHPLEMGVSSKTQEYDECLQLDLPYHKPALGGRNIQVIAIAPEAGRGPHLHHHARGRHPVLGSGPARPRAQKAGRTPALSLEAWRGEPRLCQQAAGFGCHPNAGKVAVPELCAEISKRGSANAAHASAAGAREKVRRKRRSKASGCSCRPALMPGLTDPPVFIEIFCGTARLSKAIAKRTGWPVLLWDIKFGDAYDLRHLHAQHKILGWIRSGRIRGGHLGMPSQSFSRARDHPPGPPPLRSDAAPLGLPNLSSKDFDKVRAGNNLMRFSVRVMQLAAWQGIPFSLENPRASRLWLCPPVQHLLRQRAARIYVTECCMFGVPWRKSTQFVAVHADFAVLNQYRCLGAKRGLCRNSGCAHAALAGRNAHGTRLSQVAGPYPWALCKLLAQCFYNFEVSQIAAAFWKRLNQGAS